MENDDDNKVVDLGVERLRQKSPELHVECPRCRKTNFMRDTRCQHCGLWFAGEAFQFAPTEAAPGRRRRLTYILLFGVGAVVLVVLAAAIIAWLRS